MHTALLVVNLGIVVLVAALTWLVRAERAYLARSTELLEVIVEELRRR